MSKWVRITTLELLLILAAILGMAAIVVPVSQSELQDAYENIAADELERWMDGVHAYLMDRGFDGLPPILVGPGTLPDGLMVNAEIGRIEPLLSQPRVGEGTSRPYLDHFRPDPWGRAYLVLSFSTLPHYRCWILSAGRDGRVDLHTLDARHAGDDLKLPLL